jgi:hypothetical protein
MDARLSFFRLQPTLRRNTIAGAAAPSARASGFLWTHDESVSLETAMRVPQQHPLGTLSRIAGLSTRTQHTHAGGCSIAPVVEGSMLPTNRLCATAPAT